MAEFVTKDQIVEWATTEAGFDECGGRLWESGAGGAIITLPDANHYAVLRAVASRDDLDPMQLSDYIAGWHRHRKRQKGDATDEDLRELGYGG